MTEEQRELAWRLRGHPRFMWVEGMRRTTEEREVAPGLKAYAPDLSCWVTAAILLRMAMEAGPQSIAPPGMVSWAHEDWVDGNGYNLGPDLGTVAAHSLLATWDAERRDS